MKQIDIIKTYSQKSCLVVDDVPDIRTTLKRLLVDFGSENVDTAGNAEESIDLCERKQYDIVLADYNLGPGKNGQQLLEELRYYKLLRHTSLYVMITAEAASHYVLHALEYQPDDYFNKPFNRDSLRPRLDAALLRNESLLDIKKALDMGKINQAIAECQNLVETGKRKYHNDARKVWGELLCTQRKFKNALAVYAQLPDERQPLWAHIGKAKAYLGLKDYDTAENILQTIIASAPMCVDAHDLLAKVYAARNDFGHAQNALTTAVKISPRSAPRQRALGRVCQNSGDKIASVHAFRAAIKQSKNSCHESADDYLCLSKGLSELVKDSPKDIDPKLITEALESLKYAEKKYGKNPVIQMHALLLEADLYKCQGDMDGTEQAILSALKVQEEMRESALANTSIQLSIDCAKAYMELGHYDAGENLLQALAKTEPGPEHSLAIDKLLREPLTKDGVQYAAKLNRKGIDHYQKQELDAAIFAFKDVLREIPNHIGLNLNLIQALTSKHKEKPLNEKEAHLLEACFLRIGNISPDSSYAKRYDYLQKRFKKISTELQQEKQ